VHSAAVIKKAVVKMHKLQRQVSGIKPFATRAKTKRISTNKPQEDLAWPLHPSGAHTISECRTLKEKKGTCVSGLGGSDVSLSRQRLQKGDSFEIQAIVDSTNTIMIPHTILFK